MPDRETLPLTGELLDFANTLANHGGVPAGRADDLSNLLYRAAEALRTAEQKSHDILLKFDAAIQMQAARAETAEQRAEKYRTALERIAGGFNISAYNMRQIAHEALHGEPPTNDTEEG